MNSVRPASAAMFRRHGRADIGRKTRFQMGGEGAITKTGGNVLASKNNVINVIRILVTTKEESDDVVVLTGENVFSQLKPSSTCLFHEFFFPLLV